MSENPRARYIHVRDIKDGRSDVLPAHLPPVEPDDNSDKDKRGREDPKGPPHVEARQADGGTSFAFLQKQIGDQKTGEYEEYVNTQRSVRL